MDKSPPDLSRCGHRKCKDIVDQYCMAFYNVLYSLRNLNSLHFSEKLMNNKNHPSQDGFKME